MSASPRVVVFANQKGGVGKTTLSRELGISLADRGLRVLLVDTDPQGNLSKSLVEAEELSGGLYDALDGRSVRITTLSPTLSLLAGDGRLAALEKSLVGEIDGYLRLRRLLEAKELAGYDLVLIDSPPSLGVLSVNGLVAAGSLVIPMTAGIYALQGTNDLLATVAKVRESFNPLLELCGVIVNAWDSVPVISRQLRAEIEEAFGELVFSTVLSRSVKLEEAIAGRHGVIAHRRLERSRAKEEVEAIGVELARRLGVGIPPRELKAEVLHGLG